MARPNKTDQEVGYLGALWKELRLLEADYVGSAFITVVPSQRPGILLFRITFTPLQSDGDGPLGAHAVQIEFPNSSTQTLAGALWSASMKLTTLVYEEYRKNKGLPR